MYSKTEKTQFYIFILISYGVTFVMGALMWYGNTKGMDVSAFPNAQMLYPAAGVMLAYLLTGQTSETAQGFQSGRGKITKGFYVVFLLLTAIMVIVSILSLRIVDDLELAGQRISIWALAVQYILIVGSIACWIALGVAGKERREACGLRWKNGKSSLFCVLLFLLIYTLRMVVACAVSGEMAVLTDIAKNPVTWINFVSLIINFFFIFAAFFGEEYGWRYYMQPYLQKKFGLRGGVIVLGVVWGLWHLPVALVMNAAFFGWFLLAKPFRKKGKE